MKQTLALLTIAALGAAATVCAAAPAPCPIAYSHLSMPYDHSGGMSTPTVETAFTNETGKKIVRAKFGLIVIGEGGNMIPYDQGLTFSAGADPGKLTSSKWSLQMERVDIHHIGEILFLKSARFEDNTTWQDDGNERCRQEVNYGPK